MAKDQGKAKSRRRPTESEKGKGVGSSHDPRSLSPRSSTRAPWPRPEAMPFTGTRTTLEVLRVKVLSDYVNREKGEAWSNYHSVFYNQLLRNNLLPTRFVCTDTLTRMGILEDVQVILGRIGLGTMPYVAYPLYPELVRQFLASCDIHFDDGGHQSPQNASLTYLSGGLLYEISIAELCALYGFDRSAKATEFPTDLPYLLDLWYMIAFGDYAPRSAKLTRIRNPAVRIVAKIIGAMISGKAEAGAVITSEMTMLHFGIAPAIPDLYHETPPSYEHGVNLGFVFATMLTKRKFRGSSKNPVDEPIGSLLTPIFQYHGIDLSSTQCIDTIQRYDEAHLLHTRYLFPDLVFSYMDRRRAPHRWQLPSPAVTSVTCRANLEFLPHEIDDEPADRRRQPRRGSSSRPSQSQREDEPAPYYQQPPAGYDQTLFEELLPQYTGQFALPPPPDVSDDLEYRRWVVESATRNNSFLEQVWAAIRRIPVPRPSCFRQQPRSATDEPIVAGLGRADTGEDTDDEPLARRLPRRRRAPGQSRSVSPDEG